MRQTCTLVPVLLAAALAACGGPPSPTPVVAQAPSASATPPMPDNPLLADWTGPYGGVPPFDRVEVAHFVPAFERSMDDTLAWADRIAANPEPPTFDNTIVEMERASSKLERLLNMYYVWSGGLATPEFQKIEREIEPKLAALSDKLNQNVELFKRVDAIYQARDSGSLTSEQKRLVWKHHNDFIRAGAKLDATAKARMSQINQKLATLYTLFSQNVLADENGQFVALESEADLAGLPAAFREAAAAAAKAKKMPGKWLINNTRSSVQPFLSYSQRRDLRERVWRMFVNRGDGGGKTDNNAIISEILALRAERAKLLGYPTHAHWRLENSMAKTPERALALLERVWKPAVARVHEEVADMQAVADADKAGIRIEPWDYRFYAEKVRKQKYDLDEALLKPYLQLEKLREGMFWVAGQLFGMEFVPVTGLAVFHPDVRTWQVLDSKTGRHIGLWYLDPYAREGKRSGAWMSAYRVQQRVDGEVSPIVSNNSNFLMGKPDQPVLISWDDALTLFHEFGHALHGLSSSVTYPTLAGTNVFRDYVEFPSQLLEHWLSTPEVLNKFALHYETGKPIPRELVERVKKAANFNQGFGTVEYLASALIDMKLHTAVPANKIDPDAFEREQLKALGMPAEIVMRHRTPQFMHIFAGDGYSAGYYSYLWADVLTADAYQSFVEAGGPYDKRVAKRLYQHVFSAGNTLDPAEAYRNFRGRDAQIDALMTKRGFPIR